MTNEELIQQYPAIKSALDEQDYLLFIRRRPTIDFETVEAQLRACKILEETLPGMAPSDKAAIMVAAVIELSPVNHTAFSVEKYSPAAAALLAERNEEYICKVEEVDFAGPPSRDLSRAVIAAVTARIEYLGSEAVNKGVEHLGVAPREVEGRLLKILEENERHLRQTDAPQLSSAYRTTLRSLVDTVRGNPPSASSPTQNLSPN